MEVHHHPHIDSHLHGKKNLKEYFLEFIMIFLAVTLGFFAETIRETITENNTSSVYAQSLSEDLKKDTAQLISDMNELKFVSDKLDTFITVVHSKKISEVPGGTWYYYGRFGTRTTEFQSENATIEQLKSSGALRYFGNYAIVNALAQYDQSTQALENFINYGLTYQADIVNIRNEIFDAYYFVPVMDLQIGNQTIDSFKQQNIPLLNSSRNVMTKYASYCQLKSFNNRYIYGLEANILKDAETLLNELNKKYKHEE
jgi:hypothetical protein